MSETDHADGELEAQLRETLEVLDAPPAALVEAARASLTWLTVDAELASLVSDSAAEAAPALRAFAPPRLLTFTAGDTTLVVEIANERNVRRVLGQIVAPSTATVEIRHADGASEVTADEHGRFRITPVPGGPLSIACRFDDPTREPIVTSWVTV